MNEFGTVNASRTVTVHGIFNNSQKYVEKANYELAKIAYENGDLDEAMSYFSKTDRELDTENIYDKCLCLEKLQGIWYESDSYSDNFTIISGNKYKAQYCSIYLGLFNEPITYSMTYIDDGKIVIEGTVDGEMREYEEFYKVSDDTLTYYDESGEVKSIRVKITRERYDSLLADLKDRQETDPYIGMSEEQLKHSTWGMPKDKNITTTQYGTQEQWVYSNNRYVYLEDGVVTAIQE